METTMKNTESAPWLIELLRCPETGQSFEICDGLLTRNDGKRFPNCDGIISLVYPPLLSGEDQKMNRLYERIAPFYNFSERILGWLLTGVDMRRGREEIISLLKLKAGMRLLEVSPGPGVFQPLLRSALGMHAEIASIDLSLNMLKECQKRYSHLNISLVQGNAQYLPFVDESFEALFHFGGINLFNEPNKALHEFVRVVRKGGIVIWGDEQMSQNFKHPLGRRVLPLLNPGFLKTPPNAPKDLCDIEQYEVYKGLGYLVVARRSS